MVTKSQLGAESPDSERADFPLSHVALLCVGKNRDKPGMVLNKFMAGWLFLVVPRAGRIKKGMNVVIAEVRREGITQTQTLGFAVITLPPPLDLTHSSAAFLKEKWGWKGFGNVKKESIPHCNGGIAHFVTSGNLHLATHHKGREAQQDLFKPLGTCSLNADILMVFSKIQWLLPKKHSS